MQRSNRSLPRLTGELRNVASVSQLSRQRPQTLPDLADLTALLAKKRRDRRAQQGQEEASWATVCSEVLKQCSKQDKTKVRPLQPHYVHNMHWTNLQVQLELRELFNNAKELRELSSYMKA